MGITFMLPARRFLPSLSLLAAFEAAARTGSVTAAARELALTQSAVSRQIRALEEQLGVSLFVRERQTIRLTTAGEGYAREIRDALRRISSASLNLRANPNGGTLNLAILPTFGTRWLAPRLKNFLAENPGITINLVTRLSPFDFRLEAIDAAVHYGHHHWPGAELTFLMEEYTVPACSPGFRDAVGDLSAPETLLRMPLLHITSRPDAWERWFAANGALAEGVEGMLFDQFATAAQAAIAGLGVALLPSFLIGEELARGDLVTVGPALKSAECYYLACAVERAAYPPLAAFRRWIAEEAARDAAELTLPAKGL